MVDVQSKPNHLVFGMPSETFMAFTITRCQNFWLTDLLKKSFQALIHVVVDCSCKLLRFLISTCSFSGYRRTLGSLRASLDKLFRGFLTRSFLLFSLNLFKIRVKFLLVLTRGIGKYKNIDQD